MARAFFIVGPTASGKSELAAEVAREIGAEIISADAFQIYRGLALLTAKPEQSTLANAPHHLISTVPLTEEMNAEKFRRAATCVVEEINSRGKLAIIVGGSGLYIKALTHGLAPVPERDAQLRQRLNAMNLAELRAHLAQLDPDAAQQIDINNRRRLVRALEICMLTDKPLSGTVARVDHSGWPGSSIQAIGVFVFRDRQELYQRINQRVQAMFGCGVIEEVRAAGTPSATASQMIGLREIHELLAGTKSLPRCIAEIQLSTRRYAKRQLTWFRRQTNFLPLNLSLLTHNEAVKRILLRIQSELQINSEVRITND